MVTEIKRRLRRISLAVVFCGTFVFRSYGATLISVKEAIERAQSRNPEIKSLTEQVDAIDANARQALAPSEPSITISYADSPNFLSLGQSASTTFQINQPLGFPGKAFLNRSILKDQSKSTFHLLRSKRLAVSQLVRSTYYALGLAKKNLEINCDQKHSYERILQIAKRRYEAGSITQVDLMIAESNLYGNANDITDQKATEQQTVAQLNLLIGNDPQLEIEIEPLKMESLKSFDRAETIQKMIGNQPEIQAATAQQGAAEKAYAASWMSLLPDMQFYFGDNYYNVGTASPYAGGTELNHTYSAGIQFYIPLWGLFNEREAIVAASHNRATADANLNSQYLQSKTLLENTLNQLTASEIKLKNFHEHLLPLAEQTLELAMTNYSSGKIDFQALSDAASSLLTSKTAFYALLANYLTTYYSVGQLTGEIL